MRLSGLIQSHTIHAFAFFFLKCKAITQDLSKARGARHCHSIERTKLNVLTHMMVYLNNMLSPFMHLRLISLQTHQLAWQRPTSFYSLYEPPRDLAAASSLLASPKLNEEMSSRGKMQMSKSWKNQCYLVLSWQLKAWKAGRYQMREATRVLKSTSRTKAALHFFCA